MNQPLFVKGVQGWGQGELPQMNMLQLNLIGPSTLAENITDHSFQFLAYWTDWQMEFGRGDIILHGRGDIILHVRFGLFLVDGLVE